MLPYTFFGLTLAIGLSAAQSTTTVSLFLPNTDPQSLVASVIGTVSSQCLPHASFCPSADLFLAGRNSNYLPHLLPTRHRCQQLRLWRWRDGGRRPFNSTDGHWRSEHRVQLGRHDTSCVHREPDTEWIQYYSARDFDTGAGGYYVFPGWSDCGRAEFGSSEYWCECPCDEYVWGIDGACGIDFCDCELDFWIRVSSNHVNDGIG